MRMRETRKGYLATRERSVEPCARQEVLEVRQSGYNREFAHLGRFADHANRGKLGGNRAVKILMFGEEVKRVVGSEQEPGEKEVRRLII